MEPDSVRTTDTDLPEQREEPADPPSAALELLIPTPGQVEPDRPETIPDAVSDAPPGTASAPSPPPVPLSARDLAVLDFEKRHWRHSGAKEQAIRERFDLSASQYFQVLNALLDRPEALAAEPVLVNRLRRERDLRRRSRSSHGGDPG
jgi:hypothetical protein